MQSRKIRILSGITAGAAALAVVAAITVGAGSGTSHAAAQPAALTQAAGSWPLVDLDACPILHLNYNGGCVAQLQDDLNFIAGSIVVTVDGDFGQQTYVAVQAFQQSKGLPQDGLVGDATKQALDASLSVHSPTPPTTTPATTQAPGGGAASTPPEASVSSKPHLALGIPYSSIEFNKAQTDYFDSDESQACGLIAAYSLAVPGAGEVGEVVALACEAAVKIVEAEAVQAENQGMCLKLTFADPPAPVTILPGIYQGKYCD